MHRLPSLAFALSLLPAAALAHGPFHDAHVHDHDVLHAHAADHGHGTGALSVVALPTGASVELVLTGADVFGDAAQGLEAAQAFFAEPTEFVTFPAAAGCTAEAAVVEMTQIDDGHDVTATWSVACVTPEALTGLTVTAFDHVPALEAVEVSVTTDTDTGRAEVTPAAASLSWGQGTS